MHTTTYMVAGGSKAYDMNSLTDEQLALIREALIEANFTTVNMMNTNPELLTEKQKAKLRELLFRRQEILRELPEVQAPRPLDTREANHNL